MTFECGEIGEGDQALIEKVTSGLFDVRRRQGGLLGSGEVQARLQIVQVSNHALRSQPGMFSFEWRAGVAQGAVFQEC